MKLFNLLLIILLVGCASVAADRPAPPAASGMNEYELMTMVVDQALMIEALQGELIALQEGGADYGFVYEVEEGQSLWMIADNILGDPYKWMTIYTMNPWMGDPDLIYPYQVLILP